MLKLHCYLTLIPMTAKLYVGSEERWINHLYYEYFIPVEPIDLSFERAADPFSDGLRRQVDFLTSPRLFQDLVHPLERIDLPVGTEVAGGLFHLNLNASAEDAFFWEWLLTGNRKEGRIELYRGDSDPGLKIEFADCYCVGLYERMQFGERPMQLNLRLSPAVTRNRGVNHQKTWKVSKTGSEGKVVQQAPAVETAAYTELYVVDQQNNRITEVAPGMTIDVVMKTTGCVGKSISLNLNDKKHDYKYEGQVLVEDTLSAYEITQNIERITLEVIDPQ